MKIFIITALLAFGLISCEKDNEKDEDQLKTGMVRVVNNYGLPISNVLVAVFEGSSKKLIKNIGSLEQNATSQAVEIKGDENEEAVILYFESNSKIYMSLEPYYILMGKTNDLKIRSDVTAIQIQKGDSNYPK